MRSIRWRITAVTIAAILTSILALGGIGILTIGVESDRNAAEKMRLISENMQMGLNAYLDSLRQSVNMAIRIAHDSMDDPDMAYVGKSGTPEQVQRLDAAMKAHCAEVEHAFGSIANNTSGIVTYYYCVNADYGSTEHGFFWSKQDDGQFVKRAPLDSGDLDPKDLAHTTWYYSPLKAGSPVWVGPYTAYDLGERQVVSYVAPIYRQGFVVGVLGMDILFDTMIDQINSLKVYDTGFAFLMDRSGHTVFHPDMANGVESPTLDLSEDILKRRSTGDMLVRYTRDGRPWQLAFATLSDDHKVAVTAPVAEINASQRQLTLVILLVAAVILALFTVLTLLLMTALTKPLLHLTAASQKLVAGDYDVELNYDGKDEVGILTAAFRQMRDYLKLYIGELSSRAYTDAMTGVKNKGAFTSAVGKLDHAIQEGAQHEFGIIIFDCNDLKQINDSYGHNSGDIYLKTACRIICRTFAHSPVFRMGGDEFSVILQGVDYENRDALMDSFDREVDAHNAGVRECWERVNIAKGLAVFDGATDHSVGDVLNRADELMYRDKDDYRNNRDSQGEP